MTPRLGTTVYEIATGEPFAVIGGGPQVTWLRSESGRIRQYSPKSFRLRREPNNLSPEGYAGIVKGHAKRQAAERAAAIAKYGERLVELADLNRLSYEQAAEACR